MGGGTVLELGSGPGWDADHLESRGVQVLRTGAVLLHLTRAEFCDVLDRAWAAVGVGGLLAFTLKEGQGDGWTQAKLGLPRHFTYWREAEVRTALHTSGWEVLSRAHVDRPPRALAARHRPRLRPRSDRAVRPDRAARAARAAPA